MDEQDNPSGLVAHTPEAGNWHLLEDHLLAVAERAREFGARFEAADSSYLAGLWHDLGKAHPEFQTYLRAAARGQSATGVPHAIWGAALLRQYTGEGSAFSEIGLPIAGHHAGLKEPSLVAQEVEEVSASSPTVLEAITDVAKRLPTPSLEIPSAEPLHRELRARMVLSALVDGDRLDTERHFNPESYEARQGWPEIDTLWPRFIENQTALIRDAADTEVNRVRKEVYEACLEAAEAPPGLFRLTVPTGGGKTRSSLAFGLRHALTHDRERIIVAIPYTSIIDQTAQTYRDILGSEAVLEHHSNVDQADDEGQEPTHVRRRLATENWDVPLVVTTTVQLFESLFSHHPSRVRKIHRLANSVIILDEVQTLPVHLLKPITDVLRTLIERYGTTVVLCTATQPALQDTPLNLEETAVREIVPQYPDHFRTLERVRFERMPNSVSWEELAATLSNHDQVLAILNTRHDALAVLNQLRPDETLVHLSTLLCPAHRRDKLARIHQALDDGQPVRVISTQVVEAGVDIDFPAVYRAMGPLDRIVQAAGRCNREGTREEGLVRIFDPVEGGAPGGPYRHGLGIARSLL